MVCGIRGLCRHVELRKLESVFLGETDEVGSNDVSKDKVDGIQFSEKASFDEVVTSLIDEVSQMVL